MKFRSVILDVWSLLIYPSPYCSTTEKCLKPWWHYRKYLRALAPVLKKSSQMGRLILAYLPFLKLVSTEKLLYCRMVVLSSALPSHMQQCLAWSSEGTINPESSPSRPRLISHCEPISHILITVHDIIILRFVCCNCQVLICCRTHLVLPIVPPLVGDLVRRSTEG